MTPDLMTRCRPWIGALLLAGLLAVPGGTVTALEPGNSDPPARHYFSGSYAGGLAVDGAGATSDLPTTNLPVTVTTQGTGVDSNGCLASGDQGLCPMFGVVLCEADEYAGASSVTSLTAEVGAVDIGQAAAAEQPTAGGSCGSSAEPRLVRSGDTVTVDAADQVAGKAVTFGACVDGNGNGLCRPESFESGTDTWVMRNAAQGDSPLTFRHTGASGFLYLFVFTQPDGGVPPTRGNLWGLVDTATSGLPECADGFDNDGDGGNDATDAGCLSSFDHDERGEAPSASLEVECLNLKANKASSYLERLLIGTCGGIDTPVDCLPIRGCRVELPECADAKDNDPYDNGYHDGADYPFDPDCDSPLDDRERAPSCRDGIDNDHDGWTDYPNDPGCQSYEDDDEWNSRCSDRLDNDGDGLADFPNDPGCSSRGDDDEWNRRPGVN